MTTDTDAPENLGELTDEEKEQLRTLISGSVDRLKAGLLFLGHEMRAMIDAGEAEYVQDAEPDKAPPVETPKPEHTNVNNLRYEHCIAYFIVGKLVLDGALDPTNFNFDLGGTDDQDHALPYIVNSIAQALLDGLAAFGWTHGGVAKLVDMADWGISHHKKGGAK